MILVNFNGNEVEEFPLVCEAFDFAFVNTQRQKSWHSQSEWVSLAARFVRICTAMNMEERLRERAFDGLFLFLLHSDGPRRLCMRSNSTLMKLSPENHVARSRLFCKQMSDNAGMFVLWIYEKPKNSPKKSPGIPNYSTIDKIECTSFPNQWHRVWKNHKYFWDNIYIYLLFLYKFTNQLNG